MAAEEKNANVSEAASLAAPRIEVLPANPVLFSLIIPSKMEQKLEYCIKVWTNALKDLPPGSVQILPQMNAKSMAEAYNAGLTKAVGLHTIFTHDDCFPFPRPDHQIGQKLLAHMQHCQIAGVAGSNRLTGDKWSSAGRPFLFGMVINVTPSNPCPPGRVPLEACIWELPAKRIMGMRSLDGCIIIANTNIAKQLGWDTRFTHFHHYDMDFSARCPERTKCAVLPDLLMCHQSTGTYGEKEWAVSADVFLQKYDSQFNQHETTGMGFSYGHMHGADAVQMYRHIKRLVEPLQESCQL